MNGTDTEICGKYKMGEYNLLKCYRQKGHTGPCGFTVAEEDEKPKDKQPDKKGGD